MVYGAKKFSKPPLIYEVNNENLVGTSQIKDFFEQEMKLNSVFYTHDPEEQNFNVYEANDIMRRLIYWPSLSACNLLMHEKNQLKPQFFFGKPDNLLMLEDISAVFSLEELKTIFYSIVEKY